MQAQLQWTGGRFGKGERAMRKAVAGQPSGPAGGVGMESTGRRFKAGCPGWALDVQDVGEGLNRRAQQQY